MKFFMCFVLFFIMLSVCSIMQEVNSFQAQKSDGEICIIKNPEVMEGFLDTFKSTLEQLGY